MLSEVSSLVRHQCTRLPKYWCSQVFQNAFQPEWYCWEGYNNHWLWSSTYYPHSLDFSSQNLPFVSLLTLICSYHTIIWNCRIFNFVTVLDLVKKSFTFSSTLSGEWLHDLSYIGWFKPAFSLQVPVDWHNRLWLLFKERFHLQWGYIATKFKCAPTVQYASLTV